MIDVRMKEGELPLWVEALCVTRARVISLLKSKNIQAKPFDPALCDLLPVNEKRRYAHSEPYAQSGLILPSGPDQSMDDIRYVIQTLKDIKGKI